MTLTTVCPAHYQKSYKDVRKTLTSLMTNDTILGVLPPDFQHGLLLGLRAESKEFKAEGVP